MVRGDPTSLIHCGALCPDRQLQLPVTITHGRRQPGKIRRRRFDSVSGHHFIINNLGRIYRNCKRFARRQCYSANVPVLNVRSLQAKTQTVSVYTRHTSDCSKRDDPHWKRCECVKYIYLLRDGKNKTISAKTRSWTKGCHFHKRMRTPILNLQGFHTSGCNIRDQISD